MRQKSLAGTWQKIENIKVQITYRTVLPCNYLYYGWAIRKTIHEDSLLHYGSVYVQFVLYMYVCCMTGFSAYSAKESQKVDPLHDATSEKQSHAEAL